MKKQTNPIQAPQAADNLPEELAEIRRWLSEVRFRRTLVGGVDEADVWKKLEELNALYEKAFIAAGIRQGGNDEG